MLLQKPTTNSAGIAVKPERATDAVARFRIRDMFAKAVIFAAIGLIHVAAPSRLLAQGGGKAELRPVRIATPPKLDGILDDEAWSGDPLPLDGWMSVQPHARRAGGGKYAGLDRIRCRSAVFRIPLPRSQSPTSIRTNISRRDNAFSDDWVGVSLDSSRAGQLAYHLFVNPSGIQMDALQSGSTGEDFAPDWVWQSAGHVGADGWSAEIRVPLENIRFRSGADVRMGVLFWRRLSRTGVSSSWPEMAPSKWVFESNAVVAFDELQSRRLFETIPSATFSGNQLRSDRSRWNGTRARGDFGVSVKYGLTSAVTLDATVNPDFSQVESDAFEVEVNQRFPIFFSEKRPFFMEGMGLFNLAGTGGDSTMRTAVHTQEDPRSERRPEADGGAGQTYVRSTLVRRRGSARRAAARIHGRARSDELRQGPIRRASRFGYRIRQRPQSSRGRRRRVQAGRTLSRQRVVPVLQLAHVGGPDEPGPRHPGDRTTTAPADSPLPARPSTTTPVSGWTPRSSTASG